MTTKPDENASPVCWLEQTDDLYAGFATATEIEQHLQDWIRRAPNPDIAARLTALLPPPPPALLAPPAQQPPSTRDDRLQADISGFLPRIRENAMHAALQAIAAAL